MYAYTSNMQYLWKLTLADRKWMLPVWSFVPYALCPRRSMKFVAFVTVELDSASNRVLGPIWTIPSIVDTVWRITDFWWVNCKSYLDGSNYNHRKSQKRFCHWIGKANGLSSWWWWWQALFSRGYIASTQVDIWSVNIIILWWCCVVMKL